MPAPFVSPSDWQASPAWQGDVWQEASSADDATTIDDAETFDLDLSGSLLLRWFFEPSIGDFTWRTNPPWHS